MQNAETFNIEHPTSNIEHPTPNLEPRTLNLERTDPGYGHPEATLRLPSGYPEATLRLPTSRHTGNEEGRMQNEEGK
jgi:hypothetical protein